jgi:putative membrane protein
METKKVKKQLKYNPYVPEFLRLRGSVLPQVIFQTVTVTIITTVIVILFELTDIKLSVSKAPPTAISNIFTQIIGIVVGLLLTYRTNTAYDRYLVIPLSRAVFFFFFFF